MLPLTRKVKEQAINSNALRCLRIFPLPMAKNVRLQEFTCMEDTLQASKFNNNNNNNKRN